MTPEEAERWLLSLELFGMRFGLDRMRRLLTVLGHPEREFASIHVVGTNGKSSTTRMTAAILAGHGLQVGSYLSPHLLSYCERIRIGDADIEPQAFADAVERARRAAELVNRNQPQDNLVTQFELLTAAAYSEFARRAVDVVVVEAGLGGRYDATNVIPSRVQVLTSVGLEHTKWLGPTVTAIAREKLDVVRPGATLVLGAGIHPKADAVAEQVAAQRGARILRAERDPRDTRERVEVLGPYQRRNFALARLAAEAFLGELDAAAVTAAAQAVRVPGRLQVIGQAPLTMLDGAHNPDGIEALAEALPEIASPGQRVVAVVSILDDKDVAGMLRRLVPLCAAFVFTASQNPRSLPPPTLVSQAAQLGAGAAEAVRSPTEALARARELAGPDGVVIVTGSIYLLADVLAEQTPGGRRASMM